MLSPGQAPQPGRPLEREDRERETDRPPPSSRTGVDHAAPPRPAGGWEVAFDEVPAEPDSEWDDVTQKRKASDFSPAALEAARHAYDQKKNKP
jgi:hypothetical protein